MVTLSELCTELKNWDFNKRAEKKYGEFTIKDGTFSQMSTAYLGIVHGQYFRIVDSLFNDGVYQFGKSDLIDERFNGSVWLMSVPTEILNLLGEINAWESKNAETISSPFTSESFGGYSYSKDASSATWQGAFKSKLNKWRKI